MDNREKPFPSLIFFFLWVCTQLSDPEMAYGSYKCSVNNNAKAECLQAKYLLSALRHRVSTKAEDNRGKLKTARGHENLYVVDLSPTLQSVSIAQCSSRHLCAMWPLLFVCTLWWELSAASLYPEIEMQLLNNLTLHKSQESQHSAHQHSQLIFLTYSRIIFLSCHEVEEGTGIDPLFDDFYS